MENLGTLRPIYFKEAVPVIPALDVEVTLGFFGRYLGFAELFRDATSPSYAGMQRDGVTVHIFECEAKRIAEWSSFRVIVRGIAELYAGASTAGIVHPNGKLEPRPWGTLEFTILDPSGVAITFVEPQRP
ncbi:MAG: bleomycin binding protein [Vulcanimicrobiaceae bacterium]